MKQNRDLEKQVRFKVIADLQAKLGMLANDENTLEPLLQPPPSLQQPLRAGSQLPTIKNIEEQMVSVGDPISQKNASSAAAIIKQTPSSTDQRTSADKSLAQVKDFCESRDRSPEISEPMRIPTDSESDDENQKSDIQFAPNQSNQKKNEKARRRSRAKAKERAKALIQLVRERQKPWKCKICSSFFRTSSELRQHILSNHEDQKHFCSRCPYSYRKSSNMINHRQTHFINDKYKNQAGGRECEWCKVWFANNGSLHFHLRQFHLPDDSK